MISGPVCLECDTLTFSSLAERYIYSARFDTFAPAYTMEGGGSFRYTFCICIFRS